MGFLGVVCMLIFVVIMYSLKESKYNHAFYSQGNEKVLISHSNVYDVQAGRYLLKTDCKKINRDSKAMLASACDYILTEDNDKKDELSWAIDRNNNAMISLMVMAVFLMMIGMLSVVITAQYYQVNNKFHKFKVCNITR